MRLRPIIVSARAGQSCPYSRRRGSYGFLYATSTWNLDAQRPNALATRLRSTGEPCVRTPPRIESLSSIKAPVRLRLMRSR